MKKPSQVGPASIPGYNDLKLALKHYDGNGSVNYGKALHHFQLSADQGNNDAHYHLACMYSHGKGVVQDDSKALHHYKLSRE